MKKKCMANLKICVYCGRVLKSKKSQELGAGPVCIRKRRAVYNFFLLNKSLSQEDVKGVGGQLNKRTSTAGSSPASCNIVDCKIKEGDKMPCPECGDFATAVNTGEYFLWTCPCGFEEIINNEVDL